MVADGGEGSDTNHGLIELWNVSTGKLVATLSSAANAGLNALAFSPDGKTLAVGGAGYTAGSASNTAVLELWSVSTGKLLTSPALLTGTMQVYSLAFSPDGMVLFVGTGSNLQALSTQNYGLLAYYNAGPLVNSLAVSPDGSRLAYSTLTFSPSGTSGAFSLALNLLYYPQISKLSLSPASVIGGNGSTAMITLSKPAPPGGAIVTLTSDQAQVTPTNISIAAGETSGSGKIVTSQVSSTTSATITATYVASSASATLTVNPVLIKSLSLSATRVTAGGTVTGLVTISTAAPEGGAVVALSGQVAGISYVTSLKIRAGASFGTFTIATSAAITTKTIIKVDASCNGSSRTQALTVYPESVSEIVLSATDITAGKSVIATLKLGQPAPHSGVAVTLSGQTTGVTYPSSLSIGSGETSGTFTIRTATSISSTTKVTVTGSINGIPRSAILLVQPAVRSRSRSAPQRSREGVARLQP